MKVLVIGHLTGKDIRPHLEAEAPDRLASLPFIEHDLVTFDYIELEDNSPA